MRKINQKTFDIIDRISKEHCHKVFGYLDQDDLKNEIWAICLEKLEDFDYNRGELEHFLRVAVKSRLINRFKDITKSVRSPCTRCPFYIDGLCKKFKDNKYSCSKWKNYQLSIESSNSLLNASEPQCERESISNTLNHIMLSELKHILLDNINKSHRRDFEQLIGGGRLSKQRVKRLHKEIIRVLHNLNI